MRVAMRARWALSVHHDYPSKSSCPNHSTPPTIATIFAGFFLDNPPEDLEDEDPVAVSGDEAAPGKVEDATAPGEVEAEDPPEDTEDECPTNAEDHLNFTLDKILIGAYNFEPDASSTYTYNHSVFSKTGLSNGEHTLVITTGGTMAAVLLFDYVIYT